jgi:hypothetical protein
MRRRVEGGGLGEHDDGGFGGAVHQLAGRDREPVQGGEVHDPGSLGHVRHGRGHDVEDAEYVDVEDPMEQLGRHGVEGRWRVDAGHIGEGVKPAADLGEVLGEGSLDCAPVADVGDDGCEPSVGSVRVDSVDVHGEDGPSAVQDHLGGAAARAAACSGYECDAGIGQRMVTPPSMRKSEPVTKEESSVAR